MTQGKLIIAFLLTTLSFISCRENHSKKPDELMERKIGESNLYISIPNNYTLEITDGPDFSVYYFYPTDTTIKAHFSGGFYLGNCPSYFPPDNDSCNKEKSISKILNQNADWKIYKCNDEYTIQTIVHNKNIKGCGELIHAFGSANSKADLIKLFIIFNSLDIHK